MPIKPENRNRYPDNWRDIRASILKRARHKCEQCGAPDRLEIVRGTGFHKGKWVACGGPVRCEVTGKIIASMQWYGDFEGYAVTVILTIAHLDHTPENNDPANLKALCQRCHLAHDRVDNQAKAKATRRSHTGDMFGEEA